MTTPLKNPALEGTDLNLSPAFFYEKFRLAEGTDLNLSPAFLTVA